MEVKRAQCLDCRKYVEKYVPVVYGFGADCEGLDITTDKINRVTIKAVCETCFHKNKR